MEFRLNGQMLQLDAESVTIPAARTDPEDIGEHWGVHAGAQDLKR